jgi:hypothetical protein
VIGYLVGAGVAAVAGAVIYSLGYLNGHRTRRRRTP